MASKVWMIAFYEKREKKMLLNLFKRLFGGKPEPSESAKASFSVTLTHSVHETPLPPKEELYKLTCPKMYIFKVRGRYPETKRLRTVKCFTLDPDDRDSIISQSGLYDIQSIEETSLDPATDAQISYATHLGIELSPDYSIRDLSCLITRAIRDEDRDDITPVDYNLAKMAAHRGIYLSQFSGEKNALDCLWASFSIDERLRFLIFCIHQNFLNKQDYDIEHSPYLDRYNKFAEENISNQQLLRSLSNYCGSDLSLYRNPNRQRNAYKIAVEYLMR